MKKLIIIFYTIYFILALINYSNIISITKNIWPYFINIIIPSILPLILLVNIFIKSGIFLKLSIKYPFIRKPLIILLTILLGAPSSLIFLNDLEKQNIINRKEKELYFSSFGGISFSFIYSLTLNFTKLNGFYFLFIYYLGETLIFLLSTKEKNIKVQTINNISINRKLLFESTLATFKNISIILVTSLLFNYLFMFNIEVFEKTPLLCSIIEFSYSSFLTLKMEHKYIPTLMMLILSFTSLSIYFQIFYLDSTYDLLKHIKKRWLISTINSSLFFIFFF